MRDSFAIGRIFDIEIRVHYLFPLILAFLVMTAESPLMAFLMVMMLFGVVFLHELGQASMPKVAVLSYNEVVPAKSVETEGIVRMDES